MKSKNSPVALAGMTLAALTLGAVGARPALAFENVIELHLDPDRLVDLAVVRAFAEPICPVPVPCAAGECLADALDFGLVRQIRQSPELREISPDGQSALRASVPQLVIGLEAGFKSAACVADPRCPDLEWSEVHTYDLVFDVSAEGDQLCLSLTDLEGEVPPAALADTLFGAFGRLCGTVPAANALDRLADGARLLGSAASLDVSGRRLAVRFQLDNGERTAPAADWAPFLAGEHAPDDGAPFSLFVQSSLLDAAARSSLSEALAAAGIPLSASATAAFRYTDAFTAAEGVRAAVGFPAGLCVVDGDTAFEARMSAEGGLLHVASGQSTGLVAFDELRCGARISDAESALSTAVQGTHAAFATRLLALGGLSDDGTGVDAACSALVASGPGMNCDLLPGAGELFLGGDARALLILDTERITFDADGVLLSGGLGLTGPVPERTLATIQTPLFQTSGACGAQRQDYRGSLALTGQGASCQVQVSDDPLQIFTLTASDRTGAFTDHHLVTLNPDAALRARYFAAPYPLHITALTTAGARTFEAPAPSPSTGSAEEAAERIIAATSCRSPAVPALPGAGEYLPSWLQNAPQTLRVTFTTARGTTTRPYGGFYGGVLSTAVPPTLGRSGRFTYTGAQFTLRGRVYTRLNNGTEVDAAVSTTFVSDGTGITSATGEKLLTLRPRQTLNFTLPVGSLPAAYVSATVPLTLAPANVRFVVPAPVPGPAAQ